MKWQTIFTVFLLVIIIFAPLVNSERAEKDISYQWNFYGEHFELNIVINGTHEPEISNFDNFWTLNISVPYLAYQFYHKYPGGYRIGDNLSYLGYFITPNDTYMKELAKILNNISLEEGWNRLTEANFILTFVQNVPYVGDFASTGYVDYYKFPLETLIQQGGDCEDKAILLATILDILGYNAILFAMEVEYKGTYGHVAVGLEVEDKSGPFSVYLKDYYMYNGIKYYYMESTGSESIVTEGWSIKSVHYWVGISPEEAGVIIKNLSFVPINGSHYNGYHQKYDYVKEIKSGEGFPWYILYVSLLVIIFVSLFFYSLRFEKKRCPACGYKIQEEYQYCPNCGYWLNKKESLVEFNYEKKQ